MNRRGGRGSGTSSSSPCGLMVTIRPDGKRKITRPSGVVPTTWARTPGSCGGGRSYSLRGTCATRARLEVDLRCELDTADFDLAGVAAGSDGFESLASAELESLRAPSEATAGEASTLATVL